MFAFQGYFPRTSNFCGCVIAYPYGYTRSSAIVTLLCYNTDVSSCSSFNLVAATWDSYLVKCLLILWQKLPSLIQTRQNEPLPLKVFLFQVIEANARVSEMILYY